MNILILGGTRFFGRHLVHALLQNGHSVTIATRGRTLDSFGSQVKWIVIERTNPESLRLLFYVEQIANEKPAFIDNFDSQLPFVGSNEAGAFLLTARMYPPSF